MKQTTISAARVGTRLPAAESGGARVVILASTCFLLGAAGSAYWFHQGTKREAPVPTGAEALRQLSEVTRRCSGGSASQSKSGFTRASTPRVAGVRPGLRATGGIVAFPAYLREGAGKVKLALHDSGSSFSPDTPPPMASSRTISTRATLVFCDHDWPGGTPRDPCSTLRGLGARSRDGRDARHFPAY